MQGAKDAAVHGHSVRLGRGAACGCAWVKRGAGFGRSGCGRGAACGGARAAAWGCARALYVPVHGRSVELRMRDSSGRAGA